MLLCSLCACNMSMCWEVGGCSRHMAIHFNLHMREKFTSPFFVSFQGCITHSSQMGSSSALWIINTHEKLEINNATTKPLTFPSLGCIRVLTQQCQWYISMQQVYYCLYYTTFRYNSSLYILEAYQTSNIPINTFLSSGMRTTGPKISAQWEI